MCTDSPLPHCLLVKHTKSVCFLCFACPQRAYNQYVLECSVQYKVDKMPYSIPPKFKPSGSKKVTFSVCFFLLDLYNVTSLLTSTYLRVSVSERWYNSAEARLIAVVSCCSGGDGCDMEQARQSVLCSSVDHHPGCSSWVAIARPTHISTI